MNGRAIPLKFDPPPRHPVIRSGCSSMLLNCFIVSRPITDCCVITWLSTDPKP